MILRWMLSVVVLGVLVAAGGSPVAHLCRYLGLPRRWLWLGLMSLSVGLPVVLALAAHPTPATGQAHPFASRRTTGSSLSTTGASTVPRPEPGTKDLVLLLAWGAASLGLAGIFAASHRRALRELAACERREMLGAKFAMSLNFGPAAVGLIRSEVVLPEWVLALPRDEQQLVLLHELEHIRAGDHFVLLAGVAMAVAMPWNIGLWWQLRRLRIGMELDCDARVAPAPQDRPRYAELLLRARSERSTQRLALALTPTPSALAERLFALLDLRRPSRGRVAIWSLSAVACVVVGTRVPIPDLGPMLRSAPPEQPVAAVHTAELQGISAAVPTPTSRPQPTTGRSVAGHQTRVSALTTDSALRRVARPRYDSLIPYVQGQPTFAHATRAGAAVAGGATRAVISMPPDSARQLNK